MVLWGHRPVTDILPADSSPACSSLPMCILWSSESRSESEIKSRSCYRRTGSGNINIEAVVISQFSTHKKKTLRTKMTNDKQRKVSIYRWAFVLGWTALSHSLCDLKCQNASHEGLVGLSATPWQLPPNVFFQKHWSDKYASCSYHTGVQR